MRPQPNMAGFADAQQALRDRFGQDVTFHVPVDATYDNADPESGAPYDPWASPATGGGAPTDVVKRCSLVSRPLSSVNDDAQAAALGVMDADHVALIMSPQDWQDVQSATHFTVLDERFKVTDSRPDAMSTHYSRRIVYGAKG